MGDSGGLRAQLPRLRLDRPARRGDPGGARPALAAVAAPRRARVARRVHGADRRPALLPRHRGAVGGPRAAGGPALVRSAVGARAPRRVVQLSGADLPFAAALRRRGRLSVGATGLALATLVAVGIGVHNLGEGLAIGSSFAVGELALGTFLIVGFMVHNVTEGLGIATPIAEGGRPRASAGWSRSRSWRARRRSSAPGSAASSRATSGRAVLRRGRGRRARGRHRGRPLRGAQGAGRDNVALRAGRVLRRHRDHVRHRAVRRIASASRVRSTGR